MATLNILVEAAKLVEYDKDMCEYRKKLSGERHIGSGTCNKSNLRLTQSQQGRLQQVNANAHALRRGARETHNILEKNRRADMKNYFQKLKCNLPKLRDMVKASNVSILTVAVKYIQDMTAADKQYQIEIARLQKVRSELEFRIKVIKEDIRIQHFPSIFGDAKETESEKNSYQVTTTTSSSPKKMMSVEIQANESDIKAELPPPPDEIIDVVDVVENQANNRNYLTDLRNDISQNVQTSAERLSLIMNSKLSPVSAAAAAACLQDTENKTVDPLDRIFAKERENRPILQEPPPKSTNRRKRKLIAENDDTDSDNDLRIILDED